MADDPQMLTEEAPEYGAVVAFDKLVSFAEHWVEDGIHVIRSQEFDVVAGDEDFQRAVDKFAENAEDLWGYLSRQEGISENENETFLLLAKRFLAIYKELERREAQRRQRLISINLNRLRQRGEHFRNWRPGSTPGSVSPLSHA